MIDRAKFWELARAILHGPTQPQVDGTNAILDGWEQRYPNGDVRWLAYILATALWETNRTMQPVREAYWESEEWRKENLRYYPFYGRGYVQLTWKDNYQKLGALLYLDLVTNPDLALDPAIAADVIFIGMERALFTGVGLGRYFSDTVEDPINARRIVNGTDHAGDIAALYEQFKEALA